MADALKGAKAPAKKKKAAAASENGLGHNLDTLRKNLQPGMERLFKLQKTMDSELAGFRSDFAHAYEEISEKAGVKKSILIKEFRRALRIKREREKEMMLENDERDTTEALRAAFDGTPFGDLFAGELAKPAAA